MSRLATRIGPRGRAQAIQKGLSTLPTAGGAAGTIVFVAFGAPIKLQTRVRRHKRSLMFSYVFKSRGFSWTQIRKREKHRETSCSNS